MTSTRMTLGDTPSLQEIVTYAIEPALRILPVPSMDSPAARVLLLAIGLQESRFLYRRQLGGPARGYWQFEHGSKASRGGVWGVYLHRASSEFLRLLCRERDVSFDPRPIYAELEHDDVLAAGVARLLLWTHPKPLPPVGEAQAAWDYYIATWRPGKPHRMSWDALYAQAVRAVADDDPGLTAAA